MAETLKSKVVGGALWVTLEKLLVQLIGFVVSMVLARTIEPADFGTVSLLTIFFAIAYSFVNCGFGNALVQNKEAGDVEFSSVFYLSMVVATLLYLCFFVAAPTIARFYGIPELILITRVSALTLVFNAINSVQGAELSRSMRFYLKFRISLITCITSAIVGIVLACSGFGVWALVYTSLITGIVSVIANWIIIAWRPRLLFSWSAVRKLFSYGWKLSLSGLIHTIYNNLYGILIGRFYTPADLAYVNRGRSLPSLIMTTIDGTINGVSFPALAKLQDDLSSFRSGLSRMIQCSLFLVVPVMIGIALCSNQLIYLIYGEKWLHCVPYVCLACFGFALEPFCSINCAAISALGRSDIFLKLEIVKKVTAFLLIFLSYRYGVFAMMSTLALVYSPFAVACNTFVNGRLINYRGIDQLKDVAPIFLCGVIMGAIVFCTDNIFLLMSKHCNCDLLQRFFRLFLNIAVGVVSYWSLAVIFKLAPYREYASIFVNLLRGNAPKVAKLIEKTL